ncbi:hypothetical protein XELAEV_18001288mg [Xenopus laevis]|nr:hypothetical protein XELAEV_18001288mg [Xenopus laevis]
MEYCVTGKVLGFLYFFLLLLLQQQCLLLFELSSVESSLAQLRSLTLPLSATSDFSEFAMRWRNYAWRSAAKLRLAQLRILVNDPQGGASRCNTIKPEIRSRMSAFEGGMRGEQEHCEVDLSPTHGSRGSRGYRLGPHITSLGSSLEVTAPSSQSSLIGRDVLLPCKFEVDNPPVNPKFLALLWHFGDKEILRYDNKGKVSSPRLFIDEKLILEGNASLSLSNVTISDRGTYRCSVIYSPNNQQKEIRLHIHAVPEVAVAKRTLLKNQGTSLQCSVTDFYPQSITVTWLRNGKLLANSALGPLQRNADGTFRQNSTLTLTPSDTLNNPEIVCQSSLIGRDVLLPCTFRVDNPPVNPKFLALLWHFGDKEVLRYDNKGKVSSPRLFIDEKLILEGNVSLSLSNVTISDRGTYRCSVIYSPNTQQKEIRLHIHGRNEDQEDSPTVILSYLAAGNLLCYYMTFGTVKPINVTWLRNGKLLPNSVLGPLQQNEDGMFQQDSTLTLTPSFTRGNPIYACQVQHESLPTPRQDSYKVQYGAVPDVVVAKRSLLKNQGTFLQCSMTDFYPQSITVTWLRNGKLLPNSVMGPLQQNEDGTFRLNSTLTLTTSDTFDKEEIVFDHSVLSIIWIFRDKEILRYNKTLTIFQPRLTLDVQTIEEGIVSLSVSNVIVSDEGTYTCRVSYGLKQEQGVKLEVEAVPMIKISRSEENLYCSVSGFYPVDIGVSWLRDGKPIPHSSNIDKDLRPWSNADGTYTLNNSLSVAPGGGQNDGTYSCQVEHKSLPKPLLKDLQLVYSDCVPDNEGKYSAGNIAGAIFLTILLTMAGISAGLWFLIYKKKYFQRFRVSHIHRSQMLDGEKVTLYCVASDCPKDPQVIWTVEENDGKKMEITEDEPQAEGEGNMLLDQEFSVRTDRTETDGRHNVTSSLSFTPEASKIKKKSVFCKFVCDGRAKEQRLDCSFIVLKPKDSMKFSLSESGEVLSCLTLREFYPRDIQIRWSCGVGHYQQLESNETFTLNPNSSFNIESECKLPGHLFKDPGFKVRVTWNHQSSDGEESREFSAWDPGVPVVTNIRQKYRHIIMEIDQFYPQNIEITWHKAVGRQKDYWMISDDFIQNKLFPNSDGSYRLTSICDGIDLMDKMNRFDLYFTAQVQHETLNSPIQRDFQWERGVYYLLSEGQKLNPLPKSQDTAPSNSGPVERS